MELSVEGSTRRQSGKVGRYLYVVVDPRGVLEYVGLARWEAQYMMRENNGRGRGWTVRRYAQEGR